MRVKTQLLRLLIFSKMWAYCLFGMLICVLACVYVISLRRMLPQGGDSWAHYVSGGNYPSEAPSVSPDGQTLFFSSPKTGRGDIYSFRIIDSLITRLTNSDACEISPVCSPDGLTIAYGHELGGNRHVWLMNADGSDQRALTSGPFMDDVGQFSPDGKFLAVERGRMSGGLAKLVDTFVIPLDPGADSIGPLVGAFFLPNESGFVTTSPSDRNSGDCTDVCWCDIQGAIRRRIWQGEALAVSPNGEVMIVVDCPTRTAPGAPKQAPVDSARVITLNGDTIGRLTVSGNRTFTSDGGHIVYADVASYGRYLHRFSIDRSVDERIATPGGFVGPLRCARDGVLAVMLSVDGSSDRVGTVYHIDSRTWEFRRLVSLASLE